MLGKATVWRVNEENRCKERNDVWLTAVERDEAKYDAEENWINKKEKHRENRKETLNNADLLKREWTHENTVKKILLEMYFSIYSEQEKKSEKQIQ